MEDLKSKLLTETGPAFYSDLRAHAAREGLFLVESPLSLIEAGLAIARDEKSSVAAWLQANLLRRPSAAELAAWETSPTTRFESLIVQPFVLARLIEGAAPPADNC